MKIIAYLKCTGPCKRVLKIEYEGLNHLATTSYPKCTFDDNVQYEEIYALREVYPS